MFTEYPPAAELCKDRDKLSAAQQLAGVIDEDFRRVEAECVTAAGLRGVGRRVDAVVKGQSDADGAASSEVPEQVPAPGEELE